MPSTTSTERVDTVRRTRTPSYPGLPTGWGRWPTCACPRDGSSSEPWRDLLSTIR